MTESEFDDLIRSLKNHPIFADAEGCVIILYTELPEGIGTYMRGFFSMEDAETLRDAMQEALDDLPQMLETTDITRLN